MLGWFVLGVGLAVGVWLIGRAFVAADPRMLAQGLRWGAVALGVVVVVFLTLTGRLGMALAFGALLFPLFTHWQALRARWRAARGPSGGQSSQVETVFLRMTLHHDTGAMTGEVLHGPFKGRALDALSMGELLSLLETCRLDDPPSANVLEAWLDRTRPEWRRRGEGFAGREDAGARAGGGGGAGGGGPMTREEAYEILGLSPGATAAEIKEAHRRLMMKVHPDHGGSTYLAARINQAKDLLMRS